ncbi:GNAT family N-acetyltransferase [Megalodesulfovibrio paquesii]
MIIAPARPEDGPAMLALLDGVCAASFQFPEAAMLAYRAMFSPEALAARLEQGRSVVLTAMQADQSCGLLPGMLLGLLLGLPPEGGVGTIMWLLVTPEAQGQGVGSALFHAACARFRELGAHKIKLTAPTAQAVRFYERLGFHQEGFHPNHWWGQDFWALGLPLRAPDALPPNEHPKGA